jgi:hypothetical protein
MSVAWAGRGQEGVCVKAEAELRVAVLTGNILHAHMQVEPLHMRGEYRTGLCACVGLLSCPAGLLPCCGCPQGVEVPQQVYEQAYEGLNPGAD